MALFMTRKKREQIGDEIDDLLMRQYHHRCKLEEAQQAGNENVILCERGVRTFETYTRNTLDVSAIPAIKQMSHLPVIVDPSHAAGMYWMVEPLALAAVAAGADGLIIEVHNDPAHAKCDGQQSLTPQNFDALMHKVSAMVDLMGKTLVK